VCGNKIDWADVWNKNYYVRLKDGSRAEVKLLPVSLLNPIWTTLQSDKIEKLHLRYEAKQWKQLVDNVPRLFSPLIELSAPIVPVASRR
jgi:hypothetical protein